MNATQRKLVKAASKDSADSGEDWLKRMEAWLDAIPKPHRPGSGLVGWLRAWEGIWP